MVAILIDVQYLRYQKPCNHSGCNSHRCTVSTISKAMQSVFLGSVFTGVSWLMMSGFDSDGMMTWEEYCHEKTGAILFVAWGWTSDEISKLNQF